MKYSKITLVPGKVVLAIPAERKGQNLWKKTSVMGDGLRYAPSKVHVKQHFPLMAGFCITIFKAQVRSIYTKYIYFYTRRHSYLIDKSI